MPVLTRGQSALAPVVHNSYCEAAASRPPPPDN